MILSKKNAPPAKLMKGNAMQAIFVSPYFDSFNILSV